MAAAIYVYIGSGNGLLPDGTNIDVGNGLSPVQNENNT